MKKEKPVYEETEQKAFSTNLFHEFIATAFVACILLFLILKILFF